VEYIPLAKIRKNNLYSKQKGRKNNKFGIDIMERMKKNGMKKVAKIFGGFRYFLYLCSIIKSGNQPPGAAG
jgi:hypothetical protein